MSPSPDEAGPAAAADAAIIGEVLAAIAVPRLTGSAGWKATTAWLAERLGALGHDVTHQPFSFSDWPARFGPPLLGTLIALHLPATWWLLNSGRAGSALAVLLVLLGTVWLLYLLSVRALVRWPLGRREGINLYAGPHRPRWLVVAHRDSKSQPVPIALRLLAAATAAGSWVLLAGGATLETLGVAPAIGAGPLTIAGMTAGLVLAAGTVGDRSPGALDNASGVAALVAIARRLNAGDEIGFLITDAEEFGLAGASVAAGGFTFVQGVINLDGLDDAGPVHVLGPHGLRRRGGAPQLERALGEAARTRGLPFRRRDVPRGLMLDHIAFTRAGVPAITLMRGTLRSLARVHRPADSPDRLHGHGARVATDLVCAALASVSGQSGAPR